MTIHAKDYTKTTSFSKILHEKYKIKLENNISNKNTYLSHVYLSTRCFCLLISAILIVS